MTDLHHREVVVTSSSDNTPALPGWRYLYYAVCLLFGAFWGILVAGLLWLGNRKDPVMKKVHRLAFILSVASTVAILAIVVAVGLAANHAVSAASNSGSSSGSNQSTDQTADNSVVPAPDAPLELPVQSINDTPQQIADNLTALELKAMGNADARYLDHIFVSSNVQGYQNTLNIIHGGSRFDTGSASNVTGQEKGPGNMSLSYTLTIEGYGVFHSNIQVTFNGTEWLIL